MMFLVSHLIHLVPWSSLKNLMKNYQNNEIQVSKRVCLYRSSHTIDFLTKCHMTLVAKSFFVNVLFQ